MIRGFDFAPIAALDPELAQVVEEAQVPVRELAAGATRDYDLDFVELAAVEASLVSGAAYLAGKGDKQLLGRFRERIIVPRLSADFPADEVQIRPSEVSDTAVTAVKTCVALACLDGSQTDGPELATIARDKYAQQLTYTFRRRGLVREGVRPIGLPATIIPIVPTLVFANEIALNPFLQTHIQSLGEKIRGQLLDYSNSV